MKKRDTVFKYLFPVITALVISLVLPVLFNTVAINVPYGWLLVFMFLVGGGILLALSSYSKVYSNP